MAKKKAAPQKRKHEAVDLNPAIQDVIGAIALFQRDYDAGKDMTGAILNLKATVEDLAADVDQNDREG